MKVYWPQGRRSHTVFVTPGLESETSDFFNPAGMPLQFTVRFVDGVADVIAPLGKYLIDKGVAQKTALIDPGIAVAMLAQEMKVRNHRILSDAYHETIR